MSNVVLYDTEYITVEYWPDQALIHHVIHKPMSGQLEMLKEALDVGTDAMQKYKVCKWLSDDRNNSILSAEDSAWSQDYWLPFAIQAGWKYWALVVPEVLIAAGSMEPTMAALYEYGLRMMVFSTVEEAFKWIEQFDD